MSSDSLIGPYRIGRELGSGGMGKVYAATVEGTAPGLEVGTRVALKVVHAQFLELPDAAERFRREVRLGMKVAQENVVRTYDGDAIDGRWVVAMEYVEGQTLRALVDELERVPEELCRRIGHQVARGLAAIHAAGAIHRDVKPENVMITPRHEVKIMDLGIARPMDDAMRMSQAGMFVGSLPYAAPEQIRNSDSVDGRIDLHALGIVLYELAFGRNPFEAAEMGEIIRRILLESPRRLGEANPQISAFFEEVVHTLLSKERDARFATADEVAVVLGQGEECVWWRVRARTLREVTRQPLRRIRIPRETTVHGRESELATLAALFREAKDGVGRVVLLSGEAGVGKSRLVDELIGRLRQEGEELNFLFGSYPPGGAATASGAFATAYREQLGEDGASACLTQTPSLVPAFDALLRGETTPGGEQSLTKESLQTCFVHATHALAEERTTVVLIDDLHFAPEEGRALFTALAMAVPGHRVLLVGTARPGVSEAWSSELLRLEQTRSIPVPRLSGEHLQALLKETFRSERLAQELGTRIAEKSDGNPFFVFEIIRGLREGQFITKRGDGTWVTTKLIADIQIPPSVRELVQARVADLDEEERDLLDVAACCGFEFDPTLVAEACGIGAIPALKRLARIEKKHRLVRSAGSNYVFDHHQVQEALYGELHERLREQYHGAIVRTLEQRSGAASKEVANLDGALAAQLCRHALSGACREQTGRYLGRALDHLEASYLNDDAVAMAKRALAVPGLFTGVPRAEILVRTAVNLSYLGRPTEERAALDEALTLAQGANAMALLARVRELLGLHHLLLGRYEDARSVLGGAIEDACAANEPRTEASARGKLGNALYALGRFDEARAQHERQLEIARAAGDRRSEAMAAGSLGLVDHAQGRYADARARHEQYLAISREIGDRRGEGIATANLGRLFSAEGAVAAARECYARSCAVFREIGYRRGEATATGNLGSLLAREGRFAEALDSHERNLSISRAIGDQRGALRSSGNIADALRSMGLFAEAMASFERCAMLARDSGDRQSEIGFAAGLAALLRDFGDTDQALAQFEHGLALARAMRHRAGEAAHLHGLATCAEAQGRRDDAERLFREALALRRQIGDREGIAASLVALGGLVSAMGRAEEAVSILEEASSLAREIDAPAILVASVCRHAILTSTTEAAEEQLSASERRLATAERLEPHFLLWRATGNISHLEEARRLLREVHAHAPERLRESVLTRVSLHLSILSAANAEGVG